MRLITTLIAFALSTAAFAADKPSLAQAASEKMLAERIAKTYVQRGFEPANSDYATQYQKASEQFERQLESLRAASKSDKDLTENYDLLAQLWEDYKKLTAAPTTHEGAAQLADLSEELAWIAQKGSAMIEALGSSEARPVRISEDIATVSQRLAKIYLLQSYGAKRNFLPKDLAAARAEFVALDNQLKAEPDRPCIKTRLALLDSQWVFFQQAIDALANNDNDPQLRHNVITTSERIFQVAEDLASNFQRASDHH